MKTKITIKSIFGKILFEFEKEENSIKETVIEAIKNRANLRSADLRGADLWGVNLRGVNLQGANLRDANLRDADLQGANLQGANLRGVNLRGADLQGADLRGADLRDADLQGANLRDANLQGANLRDANLRGADLWGVNLRGVNLRDANLRDANLWGADLKKLIAQTTILPEGELIVWKKLRGDSLAKLLIPVNAKRVNAAGYRKCRFEFAKVIAIYDGKKKVNEGISKQDINFIYKVGEIVKPDSFDPSPLVECSNGINAFITKQEAIDY